MMQPDLTPELEGRPVLYLSAFGPVKATVTKVEADGPGGTPRARVSFTVPPGTRFEGEPAKRWAFRHELRGMKTPEEVARG